MATLPPNPVTIQIQGTIINFPSSGASPNWSPAIIDFAVAVQDALAGIVGPADVSPQTLVIDNYNPASNIVIPNLNFSTTLVRAVFIKYALYRSTNSASAYEVGTLTIVYNPNGSTNAKWDQSKSSVGNGQISFAVTDVGQVQLNVAALAGINHTGNLSYSATALLQNET